MPRFKAFISYKHVSSTGFAENLELAIKAYAKPLLRPPVSIFRDEKYLRPGADLPEMIRRALQDSEYLIYLASPAAAASEWVRSELTYWCRDEARRQKLIIVLTSGTIGTDVVTKTVDWNATDAIPRVLSDSIQMVPLYVDLSWATSAEQQSLLNPDYKKAINLIVAALRGVDPIELSGQEVLQHRKNVRLRNGAIGVIAGLSILLGVAAFLAWDQKLLADRRARAEAAQRRIADDRARDATSRRLAAEVARIAEERPDTALLLMAEAYRMGDNAPLRGAWWRLFGARPLPETYLPVDATDLYFAPDGSLVLGTQTGSTVWRRSAARWVEEKSAAAAELPKVDWRWSGGCDQGGCEERDASVWECGTSESRIIGPYGDQDDFCVASRLHPREWCDAAAFDVPGYAVQLERRGRWLSVETEVGSALYSCVAGVAQLVTGAPQFFPPSRTLQRAAASAAGSLRRISRSFDGNWMALTRDAGAVEIWSTGEVEARLGVTVLNLPASAEAIATSPQGALAVALEAQTSDEPGRIVLWEDLGDALAGKSPQRTISGLWRRRGEYGVLALSADGRQLVAGAAIRIPIVETSTGRLVSEAVIGRNAATGAQLSADGTRLLLVPRPLDGALSSAAWLFDLQRTPEPVRIGTKVRLAVFDPRQPDTLITGGEGGVQFWPAPWKTPLQESLTREPVETLVIDAERGQLAASLSDRRVLVAQLRPPHRSVVSGRRDRGANALAFLSSGEAILWASSDGLEAWDFRADEWMTIDPAEHRDVRALADLRVVGLTDGKVVVYDLSPRRWAQMTCQLVRRNLSAAEWNRFVGESFPYECTCADLPPGPGSPLKSCPSPAQPAER